MKFLAIIGVLIAGVIALKTNKYEEYEDDSFQNH